MNLNKHLLLIGTSSNAGKTFLTGFIGKILREDFNINVLPFKAQNMSNYATVCKKSKEIAIAQASQANLMGVKPKADMTAVLLKPLGDGLSQLVIRGKPGKIISARTFYREINKLKPEVDKAFENLQNESDMLIIEGAGSAFEMNLKDRDLANQYMMQKENVYTVLVTNIENGGVFPAILGSIHLMSEDERSRFRGVIINNFRGDISLFDDGRKIIEEWGVPVLGVIPHINYSLDSEDSLALMESFELKNKEVIHVGVIKYPMSSNINDIEPLLHDPNVQVSFITQRTNLNIFDKVILPGSRAVLDDLRWLKETKLADDLKTTTAEIYGICGGYQMLHEKLYDPFGTESSKRKENSEKGIGIIPANIEFKASKILKRQQYKLFDNIEVDGFEMHTGVSDQYPIYYENDRVKGSMVHEIFHNDKFRNWWISGNSKVNLCSWDFMTWKKSIQNNVANQLRNLIDWHRLLKMD